MSHSSTNRKIVEPVPSPSDNTKISSSPRPEVVGQLNSLLSNEFTLFTKTLNYHWNARGLNFASVHEFLDEQYKQLLNIIDDVAERVREVDGQPLGTLTEFTQQSTLKERPGELPDTTTMLSDLTADHEAIEAQIKEMINDTVISEKDPGTEDFLTGLLTKHETMSWMLKSHVDKTRH